MNKILPWTAALALLSGTAHAAQPPAPSSHAVATNLPGVYAFLQPPANFNARTASQQELAAWGFPPRPAASEGAAALARWLEEVNPALHRVLPDLLARPGVYHRPAQELKFGSAEPQVKSIPATSANWSGVALVPASGQQPLYSVSGRWIVPPVRQAPGTCSGGWDYSSQWVGIDGFNNQYLFQSGTAADVYCDVGTDVAEYFPWIEWLPNAELVIYKNAGTGTPYPFAAGDYVAVTVWATNWSGGVSTTGNLSFANISQGWSISLTTTAAALGGSQVTGGSAEWIVERTEVDGALATLSDYVADPWYLTKAEDLGSVLYYTGAPGTATEYNLTMLDDSNAAVSSVSAVGKNSLWSFAEGSATQ